jgi:type I restriction enzyme S subunit
MSEQWESKTFIDAIGADALFCDGDWIESKDQDPNGEVRLVQLADILDGEFKQKSERFMTRAKSNELRTTLLEKGDLLIARMPDPIGRACIFPGSEQDCVTVVDVAIARPTNCDPEWLMHCLNSQSLRTAIEERATGSTRKRISRSALSEMTLPVPPLPEQKKIAEILSGIDTAVNHLKRHHGKQDFLKKSLLNTLIFNSCNPGDPGNGNHHYLGDISTRITDGTHQAVKTSEQGTIPFLYVSCVRDGMIDWDKSAFISEEQYAIATQGRQPSPGDILYTAVGSYGNAAMVTTDRRFCFQRHIALIQLDKKKAVPKFIELALSLDQTKRSVDQVVAGNAQPTLTLGELRKLQIPLPSQDRQQQICDIISPLEKKMSALEIKIIALSNLKQAISADLLSGRKRVSV